MADTYTTSELIDLVSRLRKENEKLKDIEGVKGFAEKLKEKINNKVGNPSESFFSYSMHRLIDNLLEEMAGDPQ